MVKDMAQDHSDHAHMSSRTSMQLVFGLTALYTLVEIVGGLRTNSLALLADAGHMFTDTAAVGLSLLAMRFTERKATPSKSYGYYRAEILAALVNSIVLLLISGYILFEAWRRFQAPPVVTSVPMMLIAGVGLAVNLVSLRFLSHHSHGSLNVQGAYLEVLSDTLGSLGAIGAGLVMWKTGWYLADPIVSAGIGLFIIPRTWKLLNQAIHVLMEGTPAHISAVEVEDALKIIPGVSRVHDLHIWTITSGYDAMSGHIAVAEQVNAESVLIEAQRILKEKFSIGHATIQLEKASCQQCDEE